MSGKPGSSPVPVSGGRPTRAGAAEETLKGGWPRALGLAGAPAASRGWEGPPLTQVRHSSSPSHLRAGGKLELNTRVDRGLHALYAAPGEMYLCPSGTMAWITKRLGSEGRMRLRRGYVPPTQARVRVAARRGPGPWVAQQSSSHAVGGLTPMRTLPASALG